MKALKQGMYIGKSEFDLPEDGYTYGLNIMYNNSDLEGEITDEISNRSVIKLRKFLIGAINLIGEDLVLFSTNDEGYFEIGLQVNDNYSIIFNETMFNYTTKHRIKGEFRSTPGNKRIIYFYDGVNPDRFIRIDELDTHKDSNGDWIESSFLLKPEYNIPTPISSYVVEEGGNLPAATYTVSMRYLDDLFNATDWFSETTPLIVGKYQGEGVRLNTPTTKALSYKFSNSDIRFKYVEIAINKYDNPNTVTSYSYTVLENQQDLVFSISSLDNLSSITYAETLIPTAKYESSKAMIQYDNRLVRANLEEKYYDWSKFQRAANDVKVNWWSPFEEDFKVDYNRSLMRDEVYALGVIFVMKDGYESPVFHIPGRPMDLDNYGNPLPDNYEPNTHNRPAPTTGWDSTEYDVADYADADLIANSSMRTTFQRWEMYNTAIIDDGGNPYLGYYECREVDGTPIKYPEVKDCNGDFIYPNDGITTLPIRHHRMPDCTLSNHFINDAAHPLVLDFANINIPEEYLSDVQYFKFVVSDRLSDKTVLDKGILGTVVKQTFNQNNQESITNSNRDLRSHFIQSMQFSHDNQSPKSYSIQTSDQKWFADGGDQSMITLPACSDNIRYCKENSEQIEQYVDQPPVITALDLVAYHSPKTKFESTEVVGSHLKWERELACNLTMGDNVYSINNEKFHVINNRTKFKNRETKNILTTNVFQSFTEPEITSVPYENLTNRIISNSCFYNTDSSYNSSPERNGSPFNNKTQQECVVYKIEDSHREKYLTQTWVKDLDCTYAGLWDMTKSCWTQPATYTSAGNGTGLSGSLGGIMTHNYVAVKNYKTDCYRQLDKIRYKEFDSNIFKVKGEGQEYYECTGGDIFINKFSFRQTFFGYFPHTGNWSPQIIGKNNDFTGNMENQNKTNVADVCNAVFESKIIECWYESEYNTENRIIGEGTFNNDFFETTNNNQDDPKKYNPANANVRTQLFYPKYYGEYGNDLLMLELNTNSLSRLTNEGEWKYYQLFPNYYDTEDYTKVTCINNLRLGVNKKYKWCNPSSNKFYDTIIWSEKSFEEDVKDTYRTYKVLNSNTITANTGDIKELFLNNQQLYTQTEHSLYAVPNTNQSLQTTDGNMNIGTGAFFSLPAVKLSNTPYSYAGNFGRFNALTTEYGVFFINEVQKKVYLFREGLEDISMSIDMFCVNNLYSKLNKEYKDTLGYSYPFIDNCNFKYGVGFITTIDYPNKRFILHKKDFSPLYPIEEYTGEEQKSNVLTFNTDTNEWYFHTGEEYLFADFTNKDYWKNESFTLSYDIESKKWISFHSYQPNMMYYHTGGFYSTYNLAELWKHDDYVNKRKYYNTIYESIIEYVPQVNRQAFKTDNMQYIMKVEDSDRRLIEGKSFTKGVFYNSHQNSGEFNIQFVGNLYDTYKWSNTKKYVKVLDNIHRVTGVRDLVTDKTVPSFTKDWNAIKTFYDSSGQGYCDKVVNNSAINYNKTYYDLNMLKDQYCIARLYFKDNSANTRFRLQLLDNNYTPSFR